MPTQKEQDAMDDVNYGATAETEEDFPDTDKQLHTPVEASFALARGLVNHNLALVLKNHPELELEYLDPNSKYFDCANATAWRGALKSALANVKGGV